MKIVAVETLEVAEFPFLFWLRLHTDSGIIGTLTAGEELIITGGPLQDGAVTWYRIQTLNFTGWIRNLEHLSPAQ